MNPDPFVKDRWFERYDEFDDVTRGMSLDEQIDLINLWAREYEEYKKTPEYLKEKIAKLEKEAIALEDNYDVLDKENINFYKEVHDLKAEIKLLKRPLWKKIWDKICSNL